MTEYDAEGIAEDFVYTPTYGLHDIIPPYVVEYVADRKKIFNEQSGENSKYQLMIDIGCGNGKSTRPYAPYFRTVMGCDISKEQIKMAHQFQKTPRNIIYKVGKGESIPALDGSADLITACSAAHDMNVKQFFKECRRVIKPSGIIALYGALMKDICLINPSSQAASSAMDVYMSSYFEPMSKYFKDNDIGVWHALDKYNEIFDSEDQFQKFRRDDIENTVTLPLSEYINSRDYVPAFKKFNKRFERNVPEHRKLEQDLKRFWNISDMNSDEIIVKLVMDLYLLIFSC